MQQFSRKLFFFSILLCDLHWKSVITQVADVFKNKITSTLIDVYLIKFAHLTSQYLV